jgi:hypothetical protein
MKYFSNCILTLLLLITCACSGKDVSPKGISLQLNNESLMLPYIEAALKADSSVQIKASSADAELNIFLPSLEASSYSYEDSSRLYLEYTQADISDTFEFHHIEILELEVMNSDIKVLKVRFSAANERIPAQKDSFKLRINEGVINY